MSDRAQVPESGRASNDGHRLEAHSDQQATAGATREIPTVSALGGGVPWYRRRWARGVAAASLILVLGIAGISRWVGTNKTGCATTKPSAATAAAAGAAPAHAPPPAGPRFPTSISANHRYLLDQRGMPYLIVGDSPWSLSTRLSTSDMDFYFADRQAKGFNTALVGLLVDPYIGGRSDLSTFDGLYPFTSGTGVSSDLSTPNPAYWSRMDTMVELAQHHGITLMLAPVDTGGLLPLLRSNGATKDFNFGVFLGTRYKDSPNVVWISGNDYQTANWGNDPYVTAVAKGIRSADLDHIQTVELGYNSSTSFDDPNWPPLVNLNAAYTYYPTYDEVLKAYNEPKPDPVFMVEANYEFEDNDGGRATTNETLRRQEYWTATSGATGQLYGNHYTWTLPPDWKSRLDTKAVDQLGYLQKLVTPVAWYNLVPDQSHRVLTAGYGTCTTGGEVLDSDYTTAASTADGSLALVYVPTPRTLTIDMSRFRGPVTARWFDPTTGEFAPVGGSPVANVGTHQFAPSGKNREGDGDWALELIAK